jgi:hypothetical protein
LQGILLALEEALIDFHLPLEQEPQLALQKRPFVL